MLILTFLAGISVFCPMIALADTDTGDNSQELTRQNAQQQTDPVTLLITEVVRPDLTQEYEGWQKDIHQVLKGFTGFLGVDVIRPGDQSNLEYVTILKFDTYAHLRQWQQSPEFKEWIPKSKDFLCEDAHLQHASGLELWFTLPENETGSGRKPAYYKMVIVSTLVVFTLILTVKMLFGRVLDKLPFLPGLFISVLIVSGLMTYPVFPLVTGWLDFWLFPPFENTGC